METVGANQPDEVPREEQSSTDEIDHKAARLAHQKALIDELTAEYDIVFTPEMIATVEAEYPADDLVIKPHGQDLLLS